MKIIYWRWLDGGRRMILKDYIQKDLGDMLELADDDLILKRNPTRVLKSEIEIIRIEEKDE